MEKRGFDLGTSRMRSGCSRIWANFPSHGTETLQPAFSASFWPIQERCPIHTNGVGSTFWLKRPVKRKSGRDVFESKVTGNCFLKQWRQWGHLKMLTSRDDPSSLWRAVTWKVDPTVGNVSWWETLKKSCMCEDSGGGEAAWKCWRVVMTRQLKSRPD